MPPTDKALPPAFNQRANKSYKTDSNCQDSTPAAKGNTRQNTYTDLSRLYFQYVLHPTQDRLGELMKYCEKFLERKVCYYVHCRGFCPASLAPSTFATEAFSRAKDNFRAGIHKLRNPQCLAAWLTTTARRAVIDQLRKVNGRAKDGPYSWGPLEIDYPDGTVTHVLDRPENHDAAKRYGCVTVGQTEILKQLVYSDLLGKLFASPTGSKRQRDGIKLLEMMLTHDLTAEEIAAQQGMKKAEVSRLLRSARKKLREMAETKYKFTAEDL